MLIGGGGLFLCRTDPVLGPLVNLLDLSLRISYLLAVLGSLLAYRIYFRLNWSCGVANVFLRRTATSEQSARHDTGGRKESFHSQKPRSAYLQSFGRCEHEAFCCG